MVLAVDDNWVDHIKEPRRTCRCRVDGRCEFSGAEPGLLELLLELIGRRERFELSVDVPDHKGGPSLKVEEMNRILIVGNRGFHRAEGRVEVTPWGR